MATAAPTPTPSSDARRARWARLLPYAIILVVGLALAVTLVIVSERDPYAWMMPPLVLTAVLLLVTFLGDRRRDQETMRRLAAETGLEYDGIRPLPAVTPLLAHVTAPAHVLTGDLSPVGPWVRVAQVGDRLVAIVDAPVRHIDPVTAEWLERHPLRPLAEIGDGLLVVTVDRATPHAALLDVTRDLHDRL